MLWYALAILCLCLIVYLGVIFLKWLGALSRNVSRLIERDKAHEEAIRGLLDAGKDNAVMMGLLNSQTLDIIKRLESVEGKVDVLEYKVDLGGESFDDWVQEIGLLMSKIGVVESRISHIESDLDSDVSPNG